MRSAKLSGVGALARFAAFVRIEHPLAHAERRGGDLDPHRGVEEVRFEPSDVNPRALGRFMLILVVATLAVAFLVRVMYFALAAREASQQPPPPIMQFEEGRQPPAPRLQSDEGRDLGAFRAEEARILNTYGWIDKEQGIVRIPVDEAIRLLVKRGVSVASPPPGPGSGGK